MTNQRYRNTYLDECYHFCTATIFGFLPLLEADDSRRLMISSWNKWRKRYGIEITGYVIMPEHIHIMVFGSADAVRKFMQYSLAQTSRDIRVLLERKSKLGNVRAANNLAYIRANANGSSIAKVWKERFRSVALDREEAILVKLAYMHNNPVRRELVEKAEDWHWSSAKDYAGGHGALDVDLPG